VFVVARKDFGAWRLSRFELALKGRDQRINLGRDVALDRPSPQPILIEPFGEAPANGLDFAYARGSSEILPPTEEGLHGVRVEVSCAVALRAYDREGDRFRISDRDTFWDTKTQQNRKNIININGLLAVGCVSTAPVQSNSAGQR
jgi:hypothetical protein